MMDHDDMPRLLEDLAGRLVQLEDRVARLEQRRTATSPGQRSTVAIDAEGWTIPYQTARLEVEETWIDLHEMSARPQLQRLIRQVVEVEGPVTERLVLDRVRRAWGLRRAGGRVQEAFDQAVRQLIARNLVERRADALVRAGAGIESVRVPDPSDEDTRRGAEDVPLLELSLAATRAAGDAGGAVSEEELSMLVAKVFGWSRRGGSIQERLAQAIRLALDRGELVRDGDGVRRVV